jgi:Predicted transcriptional regulator, contains C-terminal CBS domains
MFVGMWMVKDLLTIKPESPLGDIASLMARHRIRRLPVVAEDHALLGIVSYSDVLHAFPPDINPFSAVAEDDLHRLGEDSRGLTARDIMHPNPLSIASTDPIEKAALLMRDKKIGALPVMDNHRLVGLITESDLFRAFSALFDTREAGVRITFDISSGEDVFPVVSQLITTHHLKLHTFVSLPHHSRPLCVVNIFGKNAHKMVDALWASKHAVVNVIPLGS